MALARVHNNTFPFYQHFKATCDLLPPLVHTCLLPFEKFIMQQMVWLQDSISECLHHHTLFNMLFDRISEAHCAWILSCYSLGAGTMSQPHFGQVWRWDSHSQKVGTWSPPGLLQLQSSTTEGKTPCLELFFIPLERPWSVDVENGLAWAIWTSATQVIVERRAGSQIDSLTPDHKKSGIDPTPGCAEGVRHAIGKLLRRNTRFLQTSSQFEVWAGSYELPKSQSPGTPNRDNFKAPPWESRE
jgi:hypothetical protein